MLVVHSSEAQSHHMQDWPLDESVDDYWWWSLVPGAGGGASPARSHTCVQAETIYNPPLRCSDFGIF